MAFKNYILVCAGTACESDGALEINEEFKKQLKALNLEDDAQLVTTGCFGFCAQGPIVKILPDETFYVMVKPEDVKEIVEEHIVKGRPVERLLYDKEQKHQKATVE
jgi:(2Fe-2S) ferredoxin